MFEGLGGEFRGVFKLVVGADQPLSVVDQIVGLLAGEVLGEFGPAGQRALPGRLDQGLRSAGGAFGGGQFVEILQGGMNDGAAYSDRGRDFRDSVDGA